MTDVRVTYEWAEAANPQGDTVTSEVYPDGSHPTHADVRRWFDRIADPSDHLQGIDIRPTVT